jgi:hypothetical protein
MGDDNEWGIPDWRDADAYGDWRSWSDARWRWEFCRRNWQLRFSFLYRAKRLTAAPLTKPELLTFLRSLPFVNPVKSVQLKFGYRVLPNPGLSLEPPREWLINPDPNSLHIWDAKPLRETFVEQGLSFSDKAGRALGHLLQATPVSIEESQVAVIFDLNHPLTPQIKSARAQLKGRYLETGTQPHPRDRLRDQRLALLRTLDAEAAGAHWREIVGLHPIVQNEQAKWDKLTQAQKMWLQISN